MGRTGGRGLWESHAGVLGVLPWPPHSSASGPSAPPRCPSIHQELVQSPAIWRGPCPLPRDGCSADSPPPAPSLRDVQRAARQLTCVANLLKAEQAEDAVVQLHLLAVALVHLAQDLHQLVARLGRVGARCLMHCQLVEGAVPRAADAFVLALGHPGEEDSTAVTSCTPWASAQPWSRTSHSPRGTLSVCRPQEEAGVCVRDGEKAPCKLWTHQLPTPPAVGCLLLDSSSHQPPPGPAQPYCPALPHMAAWHPLQVAVSTSGDRVRNKCSLTPSPKLRVELARDAKDSL